MSKLKGIITRKRTRRSPNPSYTQYFLQLDNGNDIELSEDWAPYLGCKLIIKTDDQ